MRLSQALLASLQATLGKLAFAHYAVQQQVRLSFVGRQPNLKISDDSFSAVFKGHTPFSSVCNADQCTFFPGIVVAICEASSTTRVFSIIHSFFEAVIIVVFVRQNFWKLFDTFPSQFSRYWNFSSPRS